MPDSGITIQRYEGTVNGFFVNAFLVETPNTVVAVDSTIFRSSVAALRQKIAETGKKLSAVLLTHGHPDHYTGAAELIKGFGDIPVIATQGTITQAKARDAEESGWLAANFSPEYPTNRMFPNQVAQPGSSYTFDGVEFTMEDFGPCESDNDVMWSIELDGTRHVFSGDMVYNQMHTFFRDGHYVNWMKQIDHCISRFDHRTVFHPGHGTEMGIEMFYWQKGYNEAFVHLLKSMLNGRETLPEGEIPALLSQMQQYCPNDRLLFLTGWQFNDMIGILREQGVL